MKPCLQLSRFAHSIFCLLLLSALPATGLAGNYLSPVISDGLSEGAPQDLIVLFDDRDVETETAGLRMRARKQFDDDTILAVRRTRYHSIKQSAKAGLQAADADEIRDYDHLPMSVLRFRNRAALDRLLADPRVLAVYEDLPVYPHLAYSLPFIGQPVVSGAGITGSGTTVAVIDTGINYTLPAFGTCTAPGTPVSCRVAASVDVTGNNVTLNADPNGHGTNIAGIVAGLATGTKISAINAFSGGVSSTSWIIAGINWAIANRSTYNITALNMSLGDNSNNTALCSSAFSNPYVTPIKNLRAAGIIPVASSGNNAFTNGISSPACTPGIVSVGAVYDANWSGPYTWSSGCTDSTSAVDKIPCFSNSASFLTMLAPGAFISAAGIQFAGTSQAAPHVAGALAVLRASYPADSLDKAIGRLTSSGVSITDSRNGISKPRLNLLAAIGVPANDTFVKRIYLGSDSGQITGNNLNATREADEPAHAGNAGGKSVWWSWTPTLSGVASINTHGSSFDTLLAVYTGSSLIGLNKIVFSDNDSSPGNTSGLSFTAQAGTEYVIAVDGFNGASGGISLNWNLVQQADLVIAMTQSPVNPYEGDFLTYTLTVTNNGPSTANGVVLTDTLPAGVGFYSASPGCTQSNGIVGCSIGPLASNTSATIQISVIAQSVGTLNNTVQVSSTTSDLQTANNSTGSNITVNPIPAVPGLSRYGIVAAFTCLVGIAGTGRRRRVATHGNTFG